MKFEFQGQTVRIAGIDDLSAGSAANFRDKINDCMTDHLEVEVDLSQTDFMDSLGLGALIWARNTTRAHRGRFRVLNPAPPVQFIMNLTRTRQCFEIVDGKASPLAGPA